MNRLEVLLFGWMPYKIKKVLFKMWFRISPAGKVSNHGERWVAGTWKSVLDTGEFYGIHHAHRYFWANSILPHKQNEQLLLDLGCGTGYGSWFLASKGFKVVGYDPDEKSIEWAKKHFVHPNLTFTSTPSLELYDYIVCFEALEHAPIEVEKSIVEHLKPDGTLIISTANGTPESVRHQLIKSGLVTVNPGHVKEFSIDEFEALLKQYFNYVMVLGQCVKDSYSFEDWNKWRKKINVKIEDFEMRKDDSTNCEVIVAVCRK